MGKEENLAGRGSSSLVSKVPKEREPSGDIPGWLFSKFRIFKEHTEDKRVRNSPAVKLIKSMF